MAKTTHKPRNGGTMTEAAFWGKLRSILRRGFMYWTPMKIALHAARRKSQSSNARLKWEFQCCVCKKWFPQKDIQLDHVHACGSLLSFEDVPQFIQNLIPEDPNAYQVLCKKTCHQLKTNEERKQRVCQKMS